MFIDFPTIVVQRVALKFDSIVFGLKIDARDTTHPFNTLLRTTPFVYQ